MIYTLTLNPALDYVIGMDYLKIGETNRTKDEFITFGGKGLNVSAVLCDLETENVALGFYGGFVGKEILQRAESRDIKCDFIELEGENSRINVKIETETESEINGAGPNVSGGALNELYLKLSSLKEGDIIVLSGSIPKNLSQTIYMDIMTRLPKGVKTVIDATGAALKNTLKCHPFLIKLSVAELSDVYGLQILVKTDAIYYGKKHIDAGAENVLISMEEKGAVFIAKSGEIYEMNAPCGEVVNHIGAGCAMLAGFISEYVSSEDYVSSLHTAVCAGSATAFSKDLPEKNEILKIINEG